VSVDTPKAGDDFRVLYVRARVAARMANARIVSGRECVERVRKSYEAK
jgi:hypothetical protein